jgi:hypothetical protein
MLVFYTICSVFSYTSWHFYAFCHGDDLGGTPWARQNAGWRPWNPRGFSTRGPAPPTGRLRQRLADGSTEEDWSRAMEAKLPQRLSRLKQNGPDKTVRGAEQE